MSNTTLQLDNNPVFTTQEAAKLLGLSVTTVQQLVESGALEAWKTAGGHRRIPQAAVVAYRSTFTTAPDEKARPSQRKLSVLVLEDNELQRNLYEKQITSWGLPVTLRFSENGYQALLDIGTFHPDVLLADIVMDGMDGYEVVSTILSQPWLNAMAIAVVTSLSLEDLEARGGIPEGVSHFPKPVNHDELRGFLRACCARKVRSQASAT